MGFFNTIGDKVRTTGNQLTSKAKDTGEQFRLNSEIQNINKQIEQQYQRIGEMYYNWKRDENLSEPDFETACGAIDVLKNQIEEREKKINDIKVQISCPGCGKMVPPDTKFCPYCGKPVDPAEIQAAEQRRIEEEKKAEAEARAAAEQARQEAEARAAAEQARQETEAGNMSEHEKAKPAGGMHFCMSCGAAVEPGMKFCMSCGAPLADEGSQAEKKTPQDISEEQLQQKAEEKETNEVQNGAVSEETVMEDASLQDHSALSETAEEQENGCGES